MVLHQNHCTPDAHYELSRVQCVYIIYIHWCNQFGNLGIRDVYLPLIYKLNEKAMVTVNTPYGRTTTFVIDQLVKQGAVLASNICSVSTGEICDQDFGAPIGLLSLRPLAFVDDILKLNTKINDVRSSHAHTLSFSKLKYNLAS